MAKKRGANGLGLSPRKRADGRWEARYPLGVDPATGKTKYKYLYASTQKECSRKLHEVAAQIDAGNFFQPRKMRCSEWFETWLNEYCTAIKEGTKSTYANVVKNYLIPKLGGLRLGDLAPHIVQKFINDLHGLSPKTIKNIHGILNKSLSVAVRVRYIDSNPASNCEMPKAVKPEIHPLEPEEIRTFERAIRGDPNEDFFFVALNTGMRLSEIIGLQWSRVNFEKGTIKVDQQMLVKRDRNSTRHLAPTKTDNTREFLPAPEVMRRLKKVQMRQNEQRLAAGPCWLGNMDLVFTNKVGEEIPHSTIEHRFSDIVKAAGLPPHHFHELRHTFVVESLRAGVDPKTVSGMVGHKSSQFTQDVYNHITETMKLDAAQKLQAHMNARG